VQFDWTLKLGDVAIVFATLLGPVFAVQAQKWLERRQEKRERRVAIFRTLMATRATRLAPNHVEALNAIPVEFYAIRGPVKKINDAWKAYLDQLSPPAMDDNTWAQKNDDLFFDLLFSLSNFLGYNFTRLELKKEVYFPSGHGKAQTEQEFIRQAFAQLLKGEISLPMDVKSFPADPTFITRQGQLQEKLLKWLDGETDVKVALDQSRLSGSFHNS